MVETVFQPEDVGSSFTKENRAKRAQQNPMNWGHQNPPREIPEMLPQLFFRDHHHHYFRPHHPFAVLGTC